MSRDKSYLKKYQNVLKLNCVNPFRTDKPSDENVKSIQKSCQELLLKNYDNPNIMEKISCIIQWIIFLSKKENNAFPELGSIFDLQKDSRLLTEEGVSSKVYTSLLLKRFEVIVKKSRDRDYMEQNLHEGIMGKIFINQLRYFTDGFCYNYAIYKKKASLCLVQEQLSMDLSRYISSIEKKSYSADYGVMIYSWLVQVMINLELAQTYGFFTHYDMHGGNILLRKNINHSPKHLLVHDLHFTFERFEHEPVIIDFGHSVCWNQTSFIGLGEFPEYGFLDFFIPGCDQFKFLAYHYLSYYKKRDKSENLGVIVNLFEFIIYHFYPTAFLKKTPLWNKEDEKWKENWFYNINYTELAVYTPYDLIKFLLKNNDAICNILKTKNLKFACKNREILNIDYSIDMDLINACIKNGLCSSFSRWGPSNRLEPCMFPMKMNAKNVITTSKMKFNEKFLYDFYEKYKTRPLLQEKPNNALISDMKNFVADPYWVVFLNQLYRGMIMIRTESQNPEIANFVLNFHQYLGLGRWFVAVIGYLYHHRK